MTESRMSSLELINSESRTCRSAMLVDGSNKSSTLVCHGFPFFVFSALTADATGSSSRLSAKAEKASSVLFFLFLVVDEDDKYNSAPVRVRLVVNSVRADVVVDVDDDDGMYPWQPRLAVDSTVDSKRIAEGAIEGTILGGCSREVVVRRSNHVPSIVGHEVAFLLLACFEHVLSTIPKKASVE
jgi:hypothetical protein